MLGGGEVLDGLRVSEDKNMIVLRRQNSEDALVPRRDVLRSGYTKMSMMPEGLLDALKGILALGVVPMDDDKTAEFLECIGAAQAAIAKADDARVYKPSGERPFTPEMQAGGVVANIELD
jgi:hypothetical protein